MTAQRGDIYGGRNPLDLPAYSLGEVAHILQVPPATIRAWSLGRSYSVAGGSRTFAPLIQIADRSTPAVSFRNAVELHVLAAIRRKHKVEMPEVRKAILYLGEVLGIEHPLADQQMMTDGKDLFIERYGQLVNISRAGQLEMRDIVDVYLSRIERDRHGAPIRLYPFTRSSAECSSPKAVSMNPRVQFGRPCVAGTSIPTAVVADRYKAGDSIEELARDYGQESPKIEEAIRFEFESRAA